MYTSTFYVKLVHCYEQVSVRLKAWRGSSFTLATEMVSRRVTSSQLMTYIIHRLPVQECVAPPLHHPGVHTNTIQDKVQQLRQMEEEGGHSEQRLKLHKDPTVIIYIAFLLFYIMIIMRCYYIEMLFTFRCRSLFRIKQSLAENRQVLVTLGLLNRWPVQLDMK